MKKPKVIIYDNDGMVTHGGRFSDKYSRAYGVDPAIMSPFFEGPFKQCLTGRADLKEKLAKVLDIWNWNGTVDELMQYWFAVGDVLDSDMYESITKLREQGAIVCLATNQEKYRTQYLVNNHSYDKVFDEVFSSADLGAYKHSAKGLEKIYNSLKEKYGIADKAEIMYWDDREGNVASLNEVGFNGQQYRDYESFKAVLAECGYRI